MMIERLRRLIGACVCVLAFVAQAQTTTRVVDVPTRPGVSQRMLVLTPTQPKAALLLFAGGHGGLQITPEGALRWGTGNFLVRSRQLFVDQGVVVALIDAPSDRQSPPFLAGYRQRPEHAADVKAAIAWMREQHAGLPVWLVGTSRGTQSVAYLATELTGPEGPDGIVLTSTILNDPRSRAVPAMPLGKIRVPVLVVHHEQDACLHCAFGDLPTLTSQLGSAPKHAMLAFRGGQNQGDPCEAMAYHGFNGLERDVVAQSAAWMLAR